MITILLSVFMVGYLNLKDRDITNRIRLYYKVIDNQDEVDKYNSLVVEKQRIEDFDLFADIVNKRKIIDIKEVNPQDYDVLKQYIKEKYDGQEQRLKFYFIEYDIEYKTGVASPRDSGVYCEIITLVNENGKWLITGDWHYAIKEDGIKVLPT